MSLVKNISLSITVTIISLVLGLLAVEIYWYYERGKDGAWNDPNTRFDAEIGWSPIPDNRLHHPHWGVISSNEFGFRSGQLDRSKDHVILLGDSVAWGFGVSDDETVSRHLEDRLAALGYQVDNLGVSGYGLDQSYLLLKRHIESIPNLKRVILIVFTGNDLANTRSNTAYGKRKPLFRAKQTGLKLTFGEINKFCTRNLISVSRILSYLAGEIRHVSKVFNALSGDKVLSLQETYNVIRALVEEMEALSRAHGAEFGIVLSPGQNELVSRSPDHVWFESLCRSGRYECLDFTEILAQAVREGHKVEDYYVDDAHYTDSGSRLMADAIYRRFNFHASDSAK